MQIDFLSKSASSKETDATVYCYEMRGKKPVCLSKGAPKECDIPIKQNDFSGKEGEIFYVYTKGGRALLLGLGSKPSQDGVRRAFATLTQHARSKNWKHITAVLPEGKNDHFAEILDGISFANYAFSLKEIAPHFVKKWSFVGASSKHKTLAKKHSLLFEGVNLTRDLVNDNADSVTPQHLVSIARGLAKKHASIKVAIFDKARLEKEKMGLLLAVNRGSARDPAMIFMEYKGNPSKKEHTAIIGKGITYDTGGLSLKPTSSMNPMRADMGGAGAVFGIIKAAASLKLKINLTGVVPTTENCIDAKSYKLGDVYYGYSGKSVEILNTDAEGRLALADALAYTSKKLKPKRMFDLATLTGAVEIALGNHRAGIFTTDKSFIKAFSDAGEQTGERIWPFPMDKEYALQLKSSIADLKNIGGRKAGSITAAAFLNEFVENIPWAHFDIAGTAFLDKPYLCGSLASGYGVRLFIKALENLDAI